jgi:hypothetical protein
VPLPITSAPIRDLLAGTNAVATVTAFAHAGNVDTGPGSSCRRTSPAWNASPDSDTRQARRPPTAGVVRHSR